MHEGVGTKEIFGNDCTLFRDLGTLRVEGCMSFINETK